MTNVTELKEVFERLVNLHHEINTLNEDVKAVKEECSETLPDVVFADLNSLAKLKATQKLGEKVSKVNEWLDLAETLN